MKATRWFLVVLGVVAAAACSDVDPVNPDDDALMYEANNDFAVISGTPQSAGTTSFTISAHCFGTNSPGQAQGLNGRRRRPREEIYGKARASNRLHGSGLPDRPQFSLVICYSQ